MSEKKDALAALSALANRHAGVETGIACAGTAAESVTYKVNGKNFVFLRPAALSLKLRQSVPEAAKFAAKDPARYQTGSSGWTTVKRPGDSPLPMEMMKRWIAESYTLMASARKAPAKKKSSKTR